MGGSKDQKASNKMMTDEAASQTKGAAEFKDRNFDDMESSRHRADETRAQLVSGYTSLLTPAEIARSDDRRGGSGGGGGGGGGGKGKLGDPRFKEAEGGYREFSKTGGWDPRRVASMDENIQGFKNIARTGGVDEAGQARIRGGGVYDEFSRTGGYSDTDRQNIRSRATSVIPAMYGRMKDEASRASTLQGGYGPGRMAMQSRLARQNASGLSDATRDAEIGIQEGVNRGRQWGAQGMTSSEQGLQDLMSQNRLSSLQGASQAEMGLVGSINSGRQFGIGGIASLAENQRQAEIQREGIRASSGSASAGRDQQQRQWEAEFGLRQKGMGLEGLSSLYSASPTEYMQNKDFDLANRGMSGNNVGQLGSSIKSGNASNWKKAGTIAKIAGSTGAAFATGGASLAVSRPWEYASEF